MKDAQHTRALTHRRGANFSLGFRLLPRVKRRAIYAVYAVCRLGDDLVDETGTHNPQQLLETLEKEIVATYQGCPRLPATRELARVLERFPIPQEAFLELLEGFRMDLTIHRYQTWQELELYCRRVAVTISRLSLAIFGATHPQAHPAGEALALGLQLTNICRDVGEDAARGRLYLPLEELQLVGLDPEAILQGQVHTLAYRALLTAVVNRARRFFFQAAPLPKSITWDCRPAVRVMGRVYRLVLEKIARDPSAAFGQRTELQVFEKLQAVMGGVVGFSFTWPAGFRPWQPPPPS